MTDSGPNSICISRGKIRPRLSIQLPAEDPANVTSQPQPRNGGFGEVWSLSYRPWPLQGPVTQDRSATGPAGRPGLRSLGGVTGRTRLQQTTVPQGPRPAGVGCPVSPRGKKTGRVFRDGGWRGEGARGRCWWRGPPGGGGEPQLLRTAAACGGGSPGLALPRASIAVVTASLPTPQFPPHEGGG